MKIIKKVISLFGLFTFGLGNLFLGVTMAQSPYDGVLDITTESRSLDDALKGGDNVAGGSGAQLFNDQVIQLIGYVIDFFIVIGIAVAFIGAYKIMTSDKDETLKEGIRLVLFGIIGIIIMVSARFIATSLVGSGGLIAKQFPTYSKTPNGIVFADELYQNIMYPFIKIALYFVVGILFIIMAGKVISFVTATDDSAKKKAGGIIIWCVVGILVVMGSKQIVEAVIGSQDSVLKKGGISVGLKGLSVSSDPARIDEQGNPIMEFGSIPLIAQIINWVMGLTMLAIIVLIIIQGYKIFTKPDDPKTRESLKKAILYILIGVLVIGAAYVISNVLVVNNVDVG